MEPAIFFITGTSGSGKTTLVEILKKELQSAEVHDFDEGGVPKGADENWRKERTEYWLKKAKQYQLNGKPAIICGVSVPEEIKKSLSYNKSLNIHYLYVHIGEKEIRKRLKARGWQDNLIEDNINWSRHLEKYVKAEKHHYIVNGELTPEEVAEKVIDFVRRQTTGN